MASIESSTLLRYLRRLDDQYFGKVLELRESIQGWLEYIPETFPHYTRHTVGHSEQIVLQLSKLLFLDDDADKPSLRLTAAEAYILVAAAFLHDAGMVCSDAEKLVILEDGTWKSWISSGGGRERWLAIDQLRNGRHPAKDSTRHFIADIQTRFLIAEFVRRIHHERAGSLVKQHEEYLGRFAFSDPELQQAIAEVCIAHGISRDLLDDRIRFPVLRQIRGDDVNLRAIAILFRLGDLLDLHNSRACPLLLNAACPLPPDSFAHWSQYQRIEHRAVSPDIIEVRAQCQTPEEHRILRDWCQWIVDEIAAAPRLLASSSPRTRWRPPSAAMTGEHATIFIKPARGARYRDRDWRFEIDSSEIFQRLISDVYDDPWQFLRELIQNALDAMRCQLYLDAENTGEPRPERPTSFGPEIRKRYLLRIQVVEQSMVNEHTGKAEARQIVTVDDCGIGLDEEIVRRFLLQVGKSYYRTEDFRRQFRFVPDSQFGIGFLSVFAVSDHVEIETFKPTSPTKDGPLKITLTGPRSYLVIEDGSRRATGTRIQVHLNPRIEVSWSWLVGQVGSGVKVYSGC